MQLKIWLIRHAESQNNAGIWSDNPNETPLTSKGQSQALKLAKIIHPTPNLLITSPLLRARQTAEPLLLKWPKIPFKIWPIQEFIYLSPKRLITLNSSERKREIMNYWMQKNPAYQDDKDAETFENFINRVKLFQIEILKLKGFVIVVGHGQFFSALLRGLKFGFEVNPQWMTQFRQQEAANPLKNCEIIKLSF